MYGRERIISHVWSKRYPSPYISMYVCWLVEMYVEAYMYVYKYLMCRSDDITLHITLPYKKQRFGIKTKRNTKYAK